MDGDENSMSFLKKIDFFGSLCTFECYMSSAVYTVACWLAGLSGHCFCFQLIKLIHRGIATNIWSREKYNKCRWILTCSQAGDAVSFGASTSLVYSQLTNPKGAASLIGSMPTKRKELDELVAQHCQAHLISVVLQLDKLP